MVDEIQLPGPHYNYPNLIHESWESDGVFAGAGPHAAIALSKTLTVYIAGTGVTAYTPARNMRLVEVGWNLVYAAGGGAALVYDLQLEKNGVVVATHAMAAPNVGLIPVGGPNVGSGRFSVEVDLIAGVDLYGITGALTAGVGVSTGVLTVNLIYEAIG